ncbi:MAG: hypothetical protein U9O83_01635 [Campylobacterota bacterium]|nr:hypothetical protein [Campylobacterota bacterium]
MDLLKSSQKSFVSDDTLGVSESIVYTHKTSTLVETVNAFVDSSDYNSEDKDKTLNQIAFANVILDEAPSKLDSILYDGIVWNVREFTKSAGMWYIKADNAKRNTVSKRSFK